MKKGEDGKGRGLWDLESCIRFRGPMVGKNRMQVALAPEVPTTCFHLLDKKSMLSYVLLTPFNYSYTEHPVSGTKSRAVDPHGHLDHQKSRSKSSKTLFSETIQFCKDRVLDRRVKPVRFAEEAPQTIQHW
jgi:hypothetical protein